MPSVISNPMPRNTSVSFGTTDSGLPFVETRTEAKKPFTVEACDRILKENGFQPLTPALRKKFGKFLRDCPSPQSV